MRTSIDLDDEIYVAAKQRAVELRCSLRTLVSRALRRELGLHPESVGGPEVSVRSAAGVPGLTLQDPDDLIHLDWSEHWSHGSNDS